MCSPDTSGVGACASPLGTALGLPLLRGLRSRCPVQLGLGTVGRGALDHGGAFTLSCWAGICPAEQKLWVRSQAQPQAAPFPAAPGGLSAPSPHHSVARWPSRVPWVPAVPAGR